MRWLLPVSLSAAIFLVGCGVAGRAVGVQDVTKNETIILQKKPGQGSITSLTITAHGSIVGQAEIQLILNGAVYKREMISGPVSVQWAGDWYADGAEVRYLSRSATGGTITFSYDFHSL